MGVAFVLAVVAIVAFAFTNGFHDAANAIATLVATRAARPGPAMVEGLPSSSSHALAGATVVEAGGSAVNWGGVGGGHPEGVAGALAALAISPVLGFGGAWVWSGPRAAPCAGPPSACPGRCSGPSG